MPPIAAGRSGQNVRRVYSFANDDIMMNTPVVRAPSAAPATVPTAAPVAAPIAAAAASRTSSSGHGSGKNTQTASSHSKNSKLYKTELCRTWMDCGRCNYGDKCQYAHGEEERRPVSRHPKYKTEFCQPFHQAGYCPYGPRCNFIHNEEQPPQSLQIRRNQTNCNGSGNVAIGNCTTNGMTVTTAPLTFGIWQPYGGSTGESPVPSSACSSSESPIGSISPTLDYDDNTGGNMIANSWNTYGGRYNNNNNPNNNMFHFHWPSTVRAPVVPTRPAPMVAQPTFDSLLSNDLFELTLNDRKRTVVTRTATENATVTCASSGRLPVFARLSNPQSAL